MRVVQLDRPWKGHQPLSVFIFYFLFWIFDKSSKFWAALRKNESNLLLVWIWPEGIFSRKKWHNFCVNLKSYRRMQSRRTTALWTIRLSSHGRRNTAAAPVAAHPPDTRRPGTPPVAASHPPHSEQNTEPHKKENVLVRTLQMKGRWESNINVWFPFIYSQKWNCYFQNRIRMFCMPVPTLIYLWEIYIFPGSVCLFCCREICGPILGIYK